MADEGYVVPLPDAGAFVAAARAIKPYIVRTPLVRLQHSGRRPIYLKLENLQPVGSFKIRCGANALLARADGKKIHVRTASAGNFAQGLAYAARDLGCTVTTVVPETAAQTKLDGIARLGAAIEKRPYGEWWDMIEHVERSLKDRSFIHPVADPAVLAGNGTIGLEILEDLPDVEAIYVPVGGGGLSVGIAAAVHGHKPNVRVYASESEAGTPVAAAFAAGKPTRIDFNARTFITGMGGAQVLPAMWPLMREQLAGTTRVTLAEVARAIKRLVIDHHIVAEGAGAVPVAGALLSPDEGGPAVCIVSGGHLDLAHLKAALDDSLA